MKSYDPTSSEVLVFSYKEGLLSKIAHDLKFRVEGFVIKWSDDDGIQASFDAASLSVVCAQVDGRDDPGAISAGDRRKIHKNLQDDVLNVRRFPEVRFQSTDVTVEGDRATVGGELTLHGTTRSLRCTAEKRNDRWIGEVSLHQPDYGIKPFRAAFGALKIRPRVRVTFSIPLSEESTSE